MVCWEFSLSLFAPMYLGGYEKKGILVKGHTKIMINQMKHGKHNRLYCFLRDKSRLKETQGGWIRMTPAPHSISRICLIDCVESSIELVGLSLEGNVARMTP